MPIKRQFKKDFIFCGVNKQTWQVYLTPAKVFCSSSQIPFSIIPGYKKTADESPAACKLNIFYNYAFLRISMIFILFSSFITG